MHELDMTADLAGKSLRILGASSPVADDVTAALVANGATLTEAVADLLLVSSPLVPDGEFEVPELKSDAEAMVENGGGRIVILLSATALVPMRRHVDYSAAMASAHARMRGLAMRFGPTLQVNAVGCGLLYGSNGDLLAGDPIMLSHLAVKDAGSTADIASAVLFLCDPQNSYMTGQILTVDGGWSVGYGRNF
jgi:NAD(P)-dependent dehydrogenase (short-subunit alcohol dehydrogenase family)